MERSKVVEIVNYWIKTGVLASKKDLGISYPEINRKIAKGELFMTSCPTLVCRTEEVKCKFEALWSDNRIMDTQRLMVVKGLLTTYAINKACQEGAVERIDFKGKKSIIYID